MAVKRLYVHKLVPRENISSGVSSGVCGGYFHTYVGSGHFFGVLNFEFQYFWGFSEKKNLGGMKILGIFFGLYLGVISIQFMVFF